MSHKCFISFKTEDKEYKRYIQEDLKIDMIDKSLNTPINSTDEDYIMRKRLFVRFNVYYSFNRRI